MSRGSLAYDRVLPAAVVALGTIALGLADGGFFARSWGPAIVAFAAAVEVALLLSAHVELSRLELVVLGLFTALVGWTALSATWSSDPAASLREAERASLYLVALLAMLFVTTRGSGRALIYGVLGGTTFVSAYGLIEYLVARPPLDPAEGSLLFEPLGYANAAGILAVMGIVISCGLVHGASSPAKAAIGAAPLAVLAPTLALTQSRGSLAALAVALVFLVALRLGLGWVQVVAVMAVLGVAGGLVVWSSGRAFYGSRPTYWRVAWHEYRADPLLGSGAGTYVRASSAASRRGEGAVRDAHDLYLESLAELGPTGLGLVAATLGLPLLALRRDRIAAAAGAAYLAFLVHAAIDWDWEMPAVTLSALACAATLLVAQRRDGNAIPLSARWRIVAGAAAATLSVAMIGAGTLS